MIDLTLRGDGCWPDLKALDELGLLVDLMGESAPAIGMALLRGGMASGRPSVTIRLELPDGRSLVTETSLAVLGQAVDAMRAATEF